MKIFVINCGSSSLKYQVIDSQKEEVLAKGLCERIGIDGRLTYQKAGGEKLITDIPMPTHTEAVASVIDALTDEKDGIIKDLSEIDAVGHRLVHGGEKFKESSLIDDAMIQAMEDVNPLAPLHNPANLIGVAACRKLMGDTPQVGVFDTAFHQTMPEKAYLYGIPYKYYEKYGIRKYGFHGTSHSFVSKRLSELIGKPYDSSKLIVAHLGNGASVCAIENGRSVDTSMGLSPLEGLVMGTRSGDIDPSAMDYLADKEGLDLKGVMEILNKKSGVYGLSGDVSSDFRDLWKGVEAGNELCRKALEVFTYRVLKYIGGYVAAMNGVDAIAFTAGLGENDFGIREMICDNLGYLGVEIDKQANKKRGEEVRISTPQSKVSVWVVPTNEELAIARETVKVLGK